MNRMATMTAGFAAALAAVAAVSAGLAQAKEATAAVEYFPTPAATGGPPLPFSEAVRVGDTLYISGQIGVTPGTLTVVPGGIGPEARQALDNIKAIAERHGASMDSLVKCTVFLVDIKDWPAFNEVYKGYFKGHFPARSALAASGLAFNARTEIECIASVAQK
jgi:2-iminobutanoate/2-iminopropanoate deaminase